MANEDCRCQCPDCKDDSCCLGIYCDNRSLENDCYDVAISKGDYIYQFMNVPNSVDDCGRCDVSEPHYHIGDSGPLCDGKPHQSWCGAIHHSVEFEFDLDSLNPKVAKMLTEE